MKNKDLQKVVLSKYEARQTQKKIFEDLNSSESYPAVKQWCKVIQEAGAIDLSKLSACHRTVCKKVPTQKIKTKSKDGKRISCRKLILEMDMPFLSA